MDNKQNQPKKAKSSTQINTHNLVVEFGKFKGERWTRIPLSYLRWLINEGTQYSDIAKAEINRRGASLTADKSVELSGHAIDKASLRLRKIWHETAIDNNEGLFSWLERMASEAYENIQPNESNVIHNRIKFVFMKGEIYPVLKTVMPAPRIRYKEVKVMGMNLLEATFKGVFMQLAVGKDYVSIYLVESKNQGRGEVQQMIDIVRGDFPDKRLTASAPLNNTIKHIFDKKGVDYANN